MYKADDYTSDWEDFILSLPNRKFTDLVKLHLGDMPSPFNKQKLVEGLMSSVKKNLNQNALIDGLDSNDILILTVIYFTGPLTHEHVRLLFMSFFLYSEINTKITNLEDRFILYEFLEVDNQIYFDITPFLKQTIAPLLDEKIFFMPEEIKTTEPKEIFINDIVLTSVFSFCYQNTEIFKKNGRPKKKFQEDIENIFPQVKDKPEILKHLFNSLENLGLAIKTEKGFLLNNERWEGFAELTIAEKYINLIAGSLFSIRQEGFANILLDLNEFFNTLSLNACYNKKDLEFFFLVLLLKNSKDRYFQMYAMSIMCEGEKKRSLIDIALSFGILCEEKENLIYVNPLLFEEETKQEKPVLIDPAFELTALPYSNLKTLLPIAKMISPVLIQTTGKFRITKKTCTKLFEEEISTEEICDILRSVCKNELPKNIILSIKEWHKKITSIKLYTGFIVQVEKEQEKFFEYNDNLKNLIRKKLSDGIYLLNINDFEEFKNAINSTGLDFSFYKPKTPKLRIKNQFTKFKVNLKKEGSKSIKKTDWQKKQKKRKTEYGIFIKEMKSKLKGKKIPKHIREYLIESIENKLIISEEQLNNSLGIKIEQNQAAGLDFLGKIRIAETALTHKDSILIEIYKNNKIQKIIGTPIELIRDADYAELKIQIKNNSTPIKLSIAQIAKISTLKTPNF